LYYSPSCPYRWPCRKPDSIQTKANANGLAITSQNPGKKQDFASQLHMTLMFLSNLDHDSIGAIISQLSNMLSVFFKDRQKEPVSGEK
jgi:peroxiredoxin